MKHVKRLLRGVILLAVTFVIPLSFVLGLLILAFGIEEGGCPPLQWGTQDYTLLFCGSLGFSYLMGHYVEL